MLLYTMVLVVLLFGLGLALFMGLVDSWFHFPLEEVHHLYVGVGIMAGTMLLSAAGVTLPFWLNVVLSVGGLGIVLDDVWQHAIQVEDPKYRSPLHRLYAVFYRLFFRIFG